MICGARLPLGVYHLSGRPRSFCDRCGPEIRYLTPPLCRICGGENQGPKDGGFLCGDCLREPPPYSIARSVVRYEEQVQRMVHQLKYSGETAVVPGFMELIENYDMTEFADIDCVVPVPLHLHRLRRRGLNQAVVLARLFFFDKLKLIKLDWLIRKRNTVPQTELGRVARRRNMRGAFQVRKAHAFRGARVCLVDDVFTTGTTVKECSKVILKNGAIEVKVLTLARVGVPRRSRRL